MKYRSLCLSMLAVSLGGCGGGGSSQIPASNPAPAPDLLPKIGAVATLSLDAEVHPLQRPDTSAYSHRYQRSQVRITENGQGLIKWEHVNESSIMHPSTQSMVYTSAAGQWSNPLLKNGEMQVLVNKSGATALVQESAIIFSKITSLAQQFNNSPETLPADWPFLKSNEGSYKFNFGEDEKSPNRILTDGTLAGFGQTNISDANVSGIQSRYSLFKYLSSGAVARKNIDNVLPVSMSPTLSADPIQPATSRPSIAGDGEVLPVISWCSFDAARKEQVILGALSNPKDPSLFNPFLIAKIPNQQSEYTCPDLDSANVVANAGNTAIAAVAWARSKSTNYQSEPFNTILEFANVSLAGGLSVANITLANNDAVEIPQFAVSTAPSGITTIVWLEATPQYQDWRHYKAQNRIAWRSYTPYNPLTKAAAVLTDTAYIPLSDTFGTHSQSVHLVAGPQGMLAAIWTKKADSTTYLTSSQNAKEGSSIYAVKFMPKSGWTSPKKLTTFIAGLKSNDGLVDSESYPTRPKVAINANGQAIATFIAPAWCGSQDNECKTSRYYLMSASF